MILISLLYLLWLWDLILSQGVGVKLINSLRYFIFSIKSSEKVSESVEFYEQFFQPSYSETDFSKMRQSIWRRIFLCAGHFYGAGYYAGRVGQQFWLNWYCLSIFTFLPSHLIILEVNEAESFTELWNKTIQYYNV